MLSFGPPRHPAPLRFNVAFVLYTGATSREEGLRGDLDALRLRRPCRSLGVGVGLRLVVVRGVVRPSWVSDAATSAQGEEVTKVDMICCGS